MWPSANPCITWPSRAAESAYNVFCSWLGAALAILPPIILISHMDFCASNVLNQYYCDYRPLLEVACSDTSLLELIVIFLAVLTLVVTLLLVTLCYTYIIRTILRITSAQQRTKASATCSSYMIVISLSYGSCIFLYMNPSPKKEGISKRKYLCSWLQLALCWTPLFIP